jgi:hypothetical protein
MDHCDPECQQITKLGHLRLDCLSEENSKVVVFVGIQALLFCAGLSLLFQAEWQRALLLSLAAIASAVTLFGLVLFAFARNNSGS